MPSARNYTTGAPVFRDFLTWIGRRVTTTPGEKARIVKFGLAVGGKIRDLISIADYTTFRRPQLFPLFLQEPKLFQRALLYSFQEARFFENSGEWTGKSRTF